MSDPVMFPVYFFLSLLIVLAVLWSWGNRFQFYACRHLLMALWHLTGLRVRTFSKVVRRLVARIREADDE
jgi:polyferredoxin